MVGTCGNEPTFYDVFLSHSSADKPWVRTLCDALQAAGLKVFLDQRELTAPHNYVGELSAALRASRFLVLVASPRGELSAWVKQEWTAFLAEHGPRDRIVVVMLEAVELPTLLKTVQQIDATRRDAGAVAAEVARAVGRVDQLGEGDARALTLGQDLVFVLDRIEDGRLEIVDPAGVKRRVAPPWQSGTAFTVARLGFQQLSQNPAESGAQRAELHTHARTLGGLLFGLLFGEAASRAMLDAAQIPGRPRPLVTLRSDDDVLLSVPWELLHDGERFLLRDQVVDLARSTLGPVAPQALLHEPTGYFKLVVNVSAPAGGGLSYEEESYRITRALSERCRIVPTELGTVVDLIDTVARETPLGIHFSGHGAPGKLQFENDEGEAHVVTIQSLLGEMRQRVPDGGLPKFFYLASCHGNEPAAPDEGRAGAESSAAAVQRAGIPQVVGYYGPILDELSTRAEEKLYGAIAAGQPTRYAVRQARMALGGPIFARGSTHRPGDPTARDAAARDTSDAGTAREEAGVPAAAGSGESSASATAVAGTHPFAWAQLVFYHHGPDHPLSRPVPAGVLREVDASLQRTFTGAGDRKILSTGFIGRRSELHRVRKRLRRGDRVLVFQGLGGLGKTTLAFQTLPLVAKEGDVCAVWCREAEQADEPAEALVAQLLEYCRRRIGLDWEGVVQQVDRAAGDDSARRFAYFFQALLQNVDRLVVYLDNLESLLVAPRGAGAAGSNAAHGGKSPVAGDAAVGAESFAEWRSDAVRAIWRLLDAAARGSGKLHVVASCRYVNDDLAAWTLPVSPLPPDALYRLLSWFPALRRLAGETRARLAGRLEGHPRAVEYANDLIHDRLAKHERRHGRWQLSEPAQAADIEREWTTLVEPALPKVRERLADNLLLAEIWEQVLEERSRRMLYRMTLLRRPWEWGLMRVLGEPAEDAEAAEATADRLARTSLLEQVEVLRNVVGGERRLVREYTVHPATAEFVVGRHGDDAALRLAAHLRIGEWLEAEAARSPYIETDLEAGHHLFAAGEYDRSCELLGGASDWLQNHGRVREGLRVLEPFLTEPVRRAMAPERVGRLLGTVGNAYAALGQVEKAIGYHEQALVILREIGDRRGEGAALGNLGLAYADLGQVEKAIGYYEQQLVIVREIGDRRGEGNALGNLGIAYAALGQVEKAIGYYEQCLTLHREIGDRRGEGNALGNLGNAYAALGQVEKAIGYYEQRLTIAREIGDRRGEGADLGNLGLAYADLGQVEKAIGYYEQQLVIVREIGDRRGEGNALGNLGSAYAALGQVEKAIGYYEQQLVIVREIGDRRGEGNALGNLGSAYAALGQVEKAIGYYEQRLKIAREIGDRRGEGNALGNLGIAYADLGQVEKAKGYWRGALKIGQEIKDPRIVGVCSQQLQKHGG